jgi:hypothetical protein
MIFPSPAIRIFRQGTKASVALCFLIGYLALFVSCRSSQAIWSSELPSPDGTAIAIARAFANGGFGISGAPATFVYVSDRVGKPKEILSFDDESDVPEDCAVELKWTGPRHLEVVYKRDLQHIGKQIMKIGTIEVSVRARSAH